MNAAGIGSLYGGLMLPFVYELAEVLFPGRTLVNLVCKVGVSCGLLSTGGNWGSMFARRLLQDNGEEDAHVGARVMRCSALVNAVFFEVLTNDLKVWPLYDLLCFAVVPPKLRPVATAMVSVCWHSYVSYRCSAQPQAVAA